MSAQHLSAQEPMLVAPTLRIPLDSERTQQLMRALQDFALQCRVEQSGAETTHAETVYSTNSVTSYALAMDTTAWPNRLLLDELRGITESKKYDSKNFYKAQLLNVMPQSDSVCRLQIAYIGIHDSTALVRAMISLQAVFTKSNNSVHLRVDAADGLAQWKTTSIDDVCFHYGSSLDVAAAERYVRNLRYYDSLLQAPRRRLDLYCFDDIAAVLRVYGVDFLIDAAGHSRGSGSTVINDNEIVVTANSSSHFGEVDPHDLWHARLRRVEQANRINHAVDEGCAFLYGGSWGYSWPAIQDSFRLWRHSHPNANWLDEYEHNENIALNKRYPLNLAYLINAYIVQKLQHDQGFAAVRSLLCCGMTEKDNANYFATLKKICGVDRSGFNAWVEGLVGNK